MDTEYYIDLVDLFYLHISWLVRIPIVMGLLGNPFSRIRV